MSHEQGDWVREGTPRDADAEWNDEQSEYGTALSPVEWDDYSNEQAVPVARPRPQAEPARSADEPETAAAQATAEQATADDPLAGPAAAEPTADAPFDEAPDAPVADGPEPVAGAEQVDALGYVETTYDEPDAFAGPDAPAEPDVFEHAAPQAAAEPEADAAPQAADEPQAVEEPVADPVAAPSSEPTADVVTPGVRVEDEADDSLAGPVDLSTQVDAPGTASSDVPGSFAEPAPEPYAEPAREPYAEPTPAAGSPDLEEDLSDEYVGQAADDAAVEDPDATRISPPLVPEPVSEETVVVEETTEVIAEPTAQVATDDLEATQVVDLSGGPGAAAVAAGGVGAAAVAAGAVPDDVYRTGETAVITDTGNGAWHAEAEANERRLAEQRQAEWLAREQRLGMVPTSEENAVRADTGPAKVTTDKFLPSFGLFVTRLVTAFLLGLGGYNILSDVDGVVAFLERQPLIPDPRLVTWILGFALGGMALLLVVGLLQRVVGFVLLAASLATVALLRWGTFNPFDNQELISGDRELLFAVIGLLLLCLGGGLWGIDGAFRRSRARAKAEKHG